MLLLRRGVVLILCIGNYKKCNSTFVVDEKYFLKVDLQMRFCRIASLKYLFNIVHVLVQKKKRKEWYLEFKSSAVDT